MTIRLTIDGAPRTKKNSSMLVFPGAGYSVWLEQVANWVRQGDRLANALASEADAAGRAKLEAEQRGWRDCRPKPPYVRVMPSKAHQQWFDQAMTQAPLLRSSAREQGANLPIDEPVNVRALIYRERSTGDAIGYYQAIGDFLQSETTNRRTGRRSRLGAGIVVDDVQIRSWNGSLLLKDAQRPRIELEITVLGDEQQVLDLRPDADELVTRAVSALGRFS